MTGRKEFRYGSGAVASPRTVAIGETPQRRRCLARVQANLDVFRRESELLNTTMTKGRDCSLNLAKTYTDTLQSKANQIRRFYTNSTWTPIYPSTGSTWTVLFLLRSRHSLGLKAHTPTCSPSFHAHPAHLRQDCLQIPMIRSVLPA